MTATQPDVASVRASAAAAVQRASQILLARQDSQGWWSGRSAGDVTLQAEALLVAEVLRIRTGEATNAAAQQIRSLQQADGRWMGGGESAAETDSLAAAGDLSASVLAYLALRLAGDSADAYHMAVAAGWIRDAGGLAASGVLARTWLALFGLAAWSEVPVPPPELSYLPGRYAASPAAVALAIIGTLRPVRTLPIDLGELRTGEEGGIGADRRQIRRRQVPVAAHSPALRRCGQWLVGWQLRSGLPPGRRPAWPCALVALYLLGYPLDHPVLATGLSRLAAATAQPRPAPGRPRPVAERQPPVLTTTLAVGALADCGLPCDHAALVDAGRWLLLQRIEGPAGGPGMAVGPEPSGWSFGRDGYPAVADTARVMLALGRITLPGLTGRPAIRNASRWLAGMQSRDGSWSGSPVVTAHVVRALATHETEPRAIRRGVVWLLREQQADGSWSACRADTAMAVTTSVLPALVAAGVLPAKPSVTAAVGWILRHQNTDGGWDPMPRSAGSQPQATARALAALLAALLTAGDGDISGRVEAAAGWLVRARQPDGGWHDETLQHFGAGIDGERRPAGRHPARRRGALLPGLLGPLGALGRYVAATAADGSGKP